jgi:hypothetical protein
VKKTLQITSQIALLLVASTWISSAQTMPPACATHTTGTAPGQATVTDCDHWQRFLTSLKSVGTVASPAITAGFSQLFTSHAGFGNDAVGYGHHFVVNEAGDLSGKVFGKLILPAVFRQDDVYIPVRSGPIGRRIGHVLKHSIVTDSADHSRGVFNVAAIPNSLLCAGLSNFYQPKVQRTAADTATRAGYNLIGFMLGDTYEEFLHPTVDKLKRELGTLFSGQKPAN